MNSCPSPAVVLGLSETGLAVARSLYRRGVNVIGIDRQPKAAACSRCFKDVHIIGDMSHESLVVKLGEISEASQCKLVLFPTNDNFVYFTQCQMHSLESIAYLPSNSSQRLEVILDKWLFYKFCNEHDLPMPITFEIASHGDVIAAAKKLAYPFIIKPRYPYFQRDHVINKAKIISSYDDLSSLNEVDFGTRGFIAQEMVHGDDLQHFSFASFVQRDGQPAAMLTAQKVRQSPPDQGVGTLVRSVVNDKVAGIGKIIIKELGYKGVSEVEIKKDSQSGEYKIIEMNARFWSQTALAMACNMDFPVMYFNDLVNVGVSKTSVTYGNPGVYWANVVEDFYCFFHPRDGYHSKYKFGIIEWLRYIPKIRAFAYWSIRDPRPFFAIFKETFFRKNVA